MTECGFLFILFLVSCVATVQHDKAEDVAALVSRANAATDVRVLDFEYELAIKRQAFWYCVWSFCSDRWNWTHRLTFAAHAFGLIEFATWRW